MPVVKTEARGPGAFVLSEEPGARSRDNITIAESQTILVGQVLGKPKKDAGAITVGPATFSGTGNGTLTLANPAYGAGVLEGDYELTLVTEGANAGQFAVRRPDGTIDGYAKVGTAYNRQLKLTVNDGSTDYAAGDKWTVPVAIADPTAVGEHKVFAPAASDGTEVATALALYPAMTGAGETKDIAAITRDAEVNGYELEWPGGITAPQKTAGILQLAAVGIIVR